MTELLHPPTTARLRARARRASAVPGRRRGSAPRPGPGLARLLLVLVLALAPLVAAGLPGGVASAAAQPGPGEPPPTAPAPGGPAIGAPTPTPTPTPPPAAPEVSIDAPGPQTSNTVTVSGRATPGAQVHLVGPGGVSLCTVTAGAAGTWTCTTTLANGARQPLTAQLVGVDGDAGRADATVSVLGAPTLTGGALVLARASGVAEPGARVTVGAAGAATVTTVADARGNWSVVLPASAYPSGTHRLSATQSSPAVPEVPESGAATATVVVDRTPPRAPVLTSPTAGTTVARQPVAFTGTGEDGAAVTVYVDGAPVCQALVARGSWSCTSAGSTLPSGTRSVQVAQVDAAGNQGALSSGTRVVVPGAPAATAPPRGGTTPGPGPTTAPAPPAPGAPAAPGEDDDQGGAAPGRPGPPADGATSDGSGTTPSAWSLGTGFGDDLADPARAVAGGTWPLAALLALAFLVVVVLPARLAASVAGDRRPLAARLTGRNRTREVTSPLSTARLDPRLAVALALTMGAGVIAVAAGVDGQVRYARLFAGIAVGLLALNLLCVVLPTVLVARLRRGTPLRVAVRVSPRLLLAATVAAAATRLLALDPPLVLGVLLTATVALRPTADAAPRGARDGASTRPGAAAALAQSVALVVVPLAAWLAHGALGPGGTGFWHHLTREALATVCLAGLASLVVGLLPVGSLPGRALWDRARPLHLATTVVAVVAAALVFVGDPRAAFPVGPALVAASLGAAVAVAAWVWTRWVEPATRED